MMIKHTKEPYPGAESAHLNIHHLSIERDGRVIATMRALGARIRDSWADRSDDHPHIIYSGPQELKDLFEGIFGYSPEDLEADILSFGIRDEMLDALDVLPGGIRAAERMDPLPNILYVDNIFVEPDFRGQGLATRMLRSLKNLSRDYDAVLLEASPFLSDFDGKKQEQLRLRAKLRVLYERSGFTPVGGEFPYMLATFSALNPKPQLSRNHPAHEHAPSL
jgi:GNAT superfamily N-acetyltransferase